jgi:hypothetical protein
MSWEKLVNIAKIPAGSFRSLGGYSSESLVVGRAMLCGFIVFVKAWRDSKYDAVLDVQGNLYRIEIKGTGSDTTISTTSGGRAGEQIDRQSESRERSLSTEDCDWLLATTSMDSYCWVIPVEFIEILNLRTMNIKQIEWFKEKWAVFLTTDPNIKPYLKSGYKNLPTIEIERIASAFNINYQNLNLTFSFDENNKRVKKHLLTYHNRLVIHIWEHIFKNIIIC